MSTKWLPTILTIWSSPSLFNFLISTELIPEFSIAIAVDLSIVSPSLMNTSPVSPSITSLAAILPSILGHKASLRLYLYLPTFAKSYLLSSNNRLFMRVWEDSKLAGSPGFNFLYISISASSLVSEFSFSRVVLR